MIKASGVHTAGSIEYDERLARPSFKRALIALFDGCGHFSEAPGIMHWRWGSTENQDRWTARADALRRRLEDHEFVEKVYDYMEIPIR